MNIYLEFYIQGKIFFKSEGIQTFQKKLKLRENITSRPALPKILKDALQAERTRHQMETYTYRKK